MQLLDGFETTAGNVLGRLPALIGEAGLQAVKKTAEWAPPLGTISLSSAAKNCAP
ncbi:MAG: methyltransferase type 11 [Proteobacteria bacterium]|nr:methyltransferase type 11 [Pseudomonadota bacterium]